MKKVAQFFGSSMQLKNIQRCFAKQKTTKSRLYDLYQCAGCKLLFNTSLWQPVINWVEKFSWLRNGRPRVPIVVLWSSGAILYSVHYSVHSPVKLRKTRSTNKVVHSSLQSCQFANIKFRSNSHSQILYLQFNIYRIFYEIQIY